MKAQKGDLIRVIDAQEPKDKRIKVIMNWLTSGKKKKINDYVKKRWW